MASFVALNESLCGMACQNKTQHSSARMGSTQKHSRKRKPTATRQRGKFQNGKYRWYKRRAQQKAVKLTRISLFAMGRM